MGPLTPRLTRYGETVSLNVASVAEAVARFTLPKLTYA